MANILVDKIKRVDILAGQNQVFTFDRLISNLDIMNNGTGVFYYSLDESASPTSENSMKVGSGVGYELRSRRPFSTLHVYAESDTEIQIVVRK